MVLIALFWLAAGMLVWVYLGYPVAAGLLARLRPLRIRADGPTPSVTVAIAVHDEAEHIARRIDDIFAQEQSGAVLEEVIVGSDGSTDGTDEIVRELARSRPRLRLLALPRSGTTPTQHALMEAAAGEVVVLTDAETRFAPGCIAALASVFRDPAVGAATGRLEWERVDATATSRNEGAYWRYELMVRALESRAGLLTAGTGAIFAVRRSAYRPVQSTTGMDHIVPLQMIEQGLRVVFVPDALGFDRPISGLREQFRNRARTATRGIGANLSMARRLPPWRYPRAALAIWSHKLFRWATPWWTTLLVGSAALLAATGHPGFVVVVIGALGGAAAAAAAHVISGSGRRPPRPLAFFRALAVVNVAFAIGWLNVARGRTIETWHRTDWEASPPAERS